MVLPSGDGVGSPGFVIDAREIVLCSLVPDTVPSVVNMSNSFAVLFFTAMND